MNATNVGNQVLFLECSCQLDQHLIRRAMIGLEIFSSALRDKNCIQYFFSTFKPGSRF